MVDNKLHSKEFLADQSKKSNGIKKSKGKGKGRYSVVVEYLVGR